MKITDFCNLGCGIALVFIIGMIYMTLAIDKSAVADAFKNTLSEEQREIYKNITNERLSIYYTGYGIGLLISMVLIAYNYSGMGGRSKLNKVGMVCLTGGVTFLTSYFYYILSPKSDSMVLHLKGDEQKREWLNVYRTMQFYYHGGLVLGIVGVMVLSTAFCG